MTAIEHLQAAKSLLETQRADAKNRYKQYEKHFHEYRNADSSEMRYAWYEYVGLSDMLDAINAALERAKEFETTESNHDQT